jgi:hypothetical protein
MSSSQFAWNGTERAEDVFRYASRLGPRDFSTQLQLILPLSKQDAYNIVDIYRSRECSELLGAPRLSVHQLAAACKELMSRIDAVLSPHPGATWFMKTNRHSLKDAPLDHPVENDLNIFRRELERTTAPPPGTSVDEVDFGPAFEAMCRARLQSTIVRTGADAVSLLARSKRIHDDFCLQIDLQDQTEWDCYLSFIAFDAAMAQYPINEFRCYISRRELRCIMQYSYLVRCPIMDDLIQSAADAICCILDDEVLPTLPADVFDVAADIQCVTIPPMRATDSYSFRVKLIELNPLGPGSVWGLLNWDTDSAWLLGNAALPAPWQRSDTAGGENKSVLCAQQRSAQSIQQSRNNLFLFAYTSRHPAGLNLGALAHVPPDYMLELWKMWKIEKLADVGVLTSSRPATEPSASSSRSGLSRCTIS